NADRHFAVRQEIVAAAGELDHDRRALDAERHARDAAEEHAALDATDATVVRRLGPLGQLDLLGPDARDRKSMDIADDVHASDELRDEPVGRPLVQLDRAPDLLDAPPI